MAFGPFFMFFLLRKAFYKINFHNKEFYHRSCSMKFTSAVAVGLAVGVVGVGSAFATFARVESMGKNTTYIMDDVSIFDNPADINLYPNYLIGGFGEYTDDVATGTNKDPQHPTFGGIFSLGLGSGDTPDPRVTIGGLFGREDSELFQFLPTKYVGDKGDTNALPETVTNFDGFLGGTLSNGNAFGLHVYIAHQDGGYETESGSYQVDGNSYASIIRGDAGINWQLGSGTDFELTGGIARVQYGPDHKDFFEDGDFSYLGNARAFFALDAIDGELIPAVRAHYVQAPGVEDKIWDKRKDIGGMVSFGIERNIWWDWFVVRVGGQKSILYTKCDVDSRNEGKNGLCSDDGTFFSTNPMGDGTSKDHVGWGFGINVEEKLKIDVTVAEDLLFRNPFQGEGRLFSRIDATYSF